MLHKKLEHLEMMLIIWDDKIVHLGDTDTYLIIVPMMTIS